MRIKDQQRDEACSSIIRIQRSRPSALAAALALLLTILFVYAVARPALPRQASDAASAEAGVSTGLRMEGLEVHFRCHSRCEDPLQARIHAAQCVEAGGAGMILPEGGGYAVICEAAKEAGEDTLTRSTAGLTLKVQGSARELSALADAISFLRAQAVETGSLAAALEKGETDASSVRALLGVYRTQGLRAMEALEDLPEQSAVSALMDAVRGDLSRLPDSAATPSGLRLLHAAACGEWIALLEELQST